MSEVERVARTAKNFEQHMLERDERDRKAGFVFGGICLGIAMLAVIAVVIMLPLKQTETALYVTNGITGRTERVTLVNRETFNESEVIKMVAGGDDLSLPVSIDSNIISVFSTF